MTTLYRNPSLDGPAKSASPGYTSYREPDTRVPPKAQPVTGEITVNGVDIPESDILAEAQNHPSDNPGAALRAAAEALVVRELLWQEAKRLGLNAEPQRDDDGRGETVRDAAIRVLVEREVEAPRASEDECRRYHESHPQKFVTEPLFEARHILVSAGRSDSEARERARLQAEAICRDLAVHPERFAVHAAEHSDCPSAKQGGNLGQLTRGSTVVEFEQALARMREGEVSATPVESRFGFHVIALDRRIEGRALAYEAVAERIAAWLEASSWSKAVSQYIAVLAGRANIDGITLKGAEGPLIQ